MEPRKFDAIVQSLASTKSRRAVLKRLVAGAVAAVPAIASTRGAEATQKRVTICHKGTTITVAAPAVPAHLAHGDHLGPCCPPGQVPCPNGCCPKGDREGHCDNTPNGCLCVTSAGIACLSEECITTPGACPVTKPCHC